MRSNNTPSTDHCCRICNKYFTLKRNLTKHLKVVHKQILKLDDKNGLRCPLDCKPRFITRNYALLRGHISYRHGVAIEYEEKTFSSLEEFASWKHCIENQSVCWYISQTAPKRLSFGQKRTYYVCHRSGWSRQASTGRRPAEFRGSCKVGTHCPSTLELTEDEGQFHVKFYKTHAGHDLELEHMTLTRDESMDLTGKIINGESNSKILESMDEELIDAETLSKRHLLGRKDLYNIKFELGKRGTDAQDESASPAVADRTTCSADKVKHKLNIMLELIENFKLDEGSYAVLERILDSTVEFVMEKGVDMNASDTIQREATTGSEEHCDESSRTSDSYLDMFPYGEGDLVDATSQFVDTLCLPIQNGSFDGVVGVQNNTVLPACGNVSVRAGTEGLEVPVSNEVREVSNTTNDLHLNVIQCSKEERSAGKGFTFVPYEQGTPPVSPASGGPIAIRDLHIDVIRFTEKCKPPRRLLPKPERRASNQVKDLHLDVIRCMREDRPPLPSFHGETTAFEDSGGLETSNETGDLHLAVFRCGSVNDPTHYAETKQLSARGNVETPPLPGKTSDLYLDVIKCKDDDAFTLPNMDVRRHVPNNNARQLNAFRCVRKKKRRQKDTITPLKRMWGNASSIWVNALDMKGGKMLDTTDFHQVYGING